jgi:two-component system response regulator HydG
MPDTRTFGNNRPARLVSAGSSAVELLGRSAAIGRVQELLRRAAAVEGGALIVGDRGTDTTGVARELHARSRPATAPWVAVTCGPGDGAMLERALFGVQPAHPPTDLESAASDSRIAAARGGTLFLQDVLELPAAIQSRLARIARDGEMRIDGDAVAIRIRFVASALPTIDSDVHEHRFRADLYRRLAVSRIDLPSLRDRSDDIPLLAARLLEEAAAAAGVARSFTQAALAVLAVLPWPGNLAELRAVTERLVATTTEEVIQVEQVLPLVRIDRAPAAFFPAGSLREARLRFEREYIAAVLQRHGWRMAEAAQTLGIQRPNLYRKARQLGIPVTRVSD